MKKILLFSLMLFSCLHAMENEKPSSLENAQQRFFTIIQNDTQDEQKKLVALKKILAKNPNDRAAILNYVGTVNDKSKTAFIIALKEKLYTIVEFLVEQPEFDVNHVENYNSSEKDKNQTPLETIIATLNSLQPLYENADDTEQKKLIEIANKILAIHKDKINTQQLFDVYIKLLHFLENISDEESIKQNIENLLLTIINHEKFDVNLVVSDGRPPLFLAICYSTSEDILNALIARGADLNRKYYPPSYKFFTTPYSILDIAILKKKYDIAKILYDAGARSIRSGTYGTLEILKYFPNEESQKALFTAINDPQNPQLSVNSWSSAKTSGLGAIGALTILYDFYRFKKPEKVTDDKKDIKAKTQEKKVAEKSETKKTEIKHDKKESKEKESKKLSRLQRLSKHARAYKKDLLKNPRNHKKLLIPVACLLFRILKDPIQYRNTRFA